MKTKYTIESGHTKKDKPFIMIEMSYKDEFTNDEYILKGAATNSSANNINFSILKNRKESGSLTLENSDTKKFIKEFFEIAKDYDFNQDFNNNHSESFSKEITSFINQCDSSMVFNGEVIDGYKDKMRGMAGINTPNKNIR